MKEARSGETRWFWLLAVGGVAAGALVRLRAWEHARSLWLDEAMLALNVASRSFLELARPLDFNQSAPLLYLWLARLSVAVAGVEERVLRAPALVGGLAALPLLALAGRRLLDRQAAAAALLLAALSPVLVRFSNEAKPYGLDAAVTAGILVAALGVADLPSRPRWALLLGCGFLGLLTSHPSVFVCGGVLAGLGLHPRARLQRGWLASCAALWLGTFAASYALLHAGSARGAVLQQTWEAAFLTPGPKLQDRAWLALRGSLLPAFAGDGSSIPAAPAALVFGLAALLLAGMTAVARRRGAWAAALLATPLLLVALASGLRRYPLGVPRLMAFAAPILLLLAAAVWSTLAAWLGPRARPSARAALLLLLVSPLLPPQLEVWRTPFEGEDARALLAAYREWRRGEREPVYVSAKGIPSWLFYTTNWEAPKRDRLRFYTLQASSGPAFENAPGRSRKVEDEGDDLVYRLRGRLELLGLATGRQWVWPGYVRRGLDEGWAANEARRIHRAALESPDYPCAWLYFTRLSEGSAKPVTWHLRDLGAVRDFAGEAPGGVFWRYCFWGTR